jgi:glucose-6-phosphate 1-dehydrogenase
MVSRVIPVDIFDLVIFGATGDLAQRKILPALYRRFADGQMPSDANIIGAARSDMTPDQWHETVRNALQTFIPKDELNAETIGAFLPRLSYVKIDAKGDDGWQDLKNIMRPDVVQAFYFSVAPSLFGALAKRLKDFEIARPDSRLVVEKPFGKDLATARELNQTLATHFNETQIYRIDHYLGKETVQNLMAIRFGNVLFEPLWNAQYIDHVQITVAEEVGVGGRGAYYDTSGAMRDMVQNHLMQLLCLTAMEPPSRFEPDAVRDEKLKVIRALDPVEQKNIIRGQYVAGDSASYVDDVENPNSMTESFIAMKVHIANWRWNGTPFYLRTGKRMRARRSEIVIHFKPTPHSIFEPDAGQHANVLSIRLQPDEGIDLRVTIKEPGPGGMRLVDVPLDMTFADVLGSQVSKVPDAYERLIMDVIRGNQTLFMRGDEVESAWAWTDPIIQGWQARGKKPYPYTPGGVGPEDALILLHKDGRRWQEIPS